MTGFPSLGALQGQWPARAAAPRSSKLNSVTRAGQRQPGTHSCSPARSHLPSPAHHLLPCARTFKLGKGRWMGRGACHNSPYLNSAISLAPPSSPLPPFPPSVAASVQCVEAAAGCISSPVPSPRGAQYSVALFTIFQLHDLPKHSHNSLFFTAPNISRTFKLFSFPPISAPGPLGTAHPNNC